jgi:MoxR-like ATPase
MKYTINELATQVNAPQGLPSWSALANSLSISIEDMQALYQDEMIIDEHNPLSLLEPKVQTNLKVDNFLTTSTVKFSKTARTPAPPPPAANDLAAIIAQSIQSYMPQQEVNMGMFEDTLARLATDIEGLKLRQPRNVEIKINDLPSVKIDTPHYMLEKCLKIATSGANLYLVGNIGCGKTHIPSDISKILGLQLYTIGCHNQMTTAGLFGYMTPQGTYVSTPLRNAYEKGGLFLLDEIDKGNPNILCSLNLLLDHDFIDFPDGRIVKHKDFKCFATANTWGNGATEQFIGSNPIDASVLNRFVRLHVDYDHDLELQLFGDVAKKYHDLRKTLEVEQVAITTRNIKQAYNLVSVGYSESEAYEIVVKSIVSENIIQSYSLL